LLLVGGPYAVWDGQFCDGDCGYIQVEHCSMAQEKVGAFVLDRLEGGNRRARQPVLKLRRPAGACR